MSKKGEQRTSRLASLLLLFGVTVTSLTLCELGLRALFPPQQFLDDRTDEYWKAFLYSRTEKLGTQDITDVAVYDADLGWRMRPNYKAEGVSHDVRGFRSTRVNQLEPGRIKILAIGDSFTYGYGVSDGETYPAYLAKLGHFEVTNAGVNGYGIDQAILMWEIEGKAFHPDLVILGYVVDDFYRNALRVRVAPKPYFEFDKTEGSFRLRGIPVPDKQTTRSLAAFQPKFSFRVVDALRWFVDKTRRKLGYPDEMGLRETSRLSSYLLNRLESSVRETGAKLIVLIIGNWYDGIPKYMYAEKAIKKSCLAQNLTCINVASAMRQANYKAFYGTHYHFTSEGNMFTANLIIQRLKANP